MAPPPRTCSTGTGCFKRLLVARALASHKAEHQLLPKVLALPVFSSDTLSSVAGATEEMMLALAVAGAAALVYKIPLAIAVVVLVFASMIAWSLSAVGDWLLSNVQRFQAVYLQATEWLEERGIFVAGILAERFDVMWLLRLFQDIAQRLNRLAGFAVLAFVFLMMALLKKGDIE
mgnify:CR=1 FL=1